VPVKIAEGLSMLQIQNSAGITVNLVLLHDSQNVILFDTGWPGQLETINEAIIDERLDLSKLSMIFITHHDMDHIGSLASIRSINPAIRVLTSTGEKEYVQFDKLPVKAYGERLNQVIKSYEKNTGLTIEQPISDQSAKKLYSNFLTTVDEVLEDGQELPYCGGIIAIHTPGHTPGHCSFYLKKYRTLVTGDALNIEAGQLVGPNPIYTGDLPLAMTSLKKFSSYKIDSIICYHGGYLTSPVGMNSAIHFLI